MINTIKVKTQQHVLKKFHSQQTNKNPDFSKHKYYFHLEHIHFMVHKDQKHAFLYSLHFQFEQGEPNYYF